MTSQPLAQKQAQLITQELESVTIPVDQVPVLGFTSNETSSAMAVNFLRCGCPAVQIVRSSLADTTYAERFLHELQHVLHALQLPGEKLESRRDKAQPFVITITRRME